MISPDGNIDVLLRWLLGRTLADVIEQITLEKRAAEAMAKQSAEPLRSQMFDYTQSCRCLKFWLTSKNRPRSCDAFEKFRNLTESLVGDGALPRWMLDAFG